MELQELRSRIDQIDHQLVDLFGQRMQIAAQIADYKKQHDLPILMPAREREKLLAVSKQAGPEMEAYTRVLYSMLFELSRSYQSKCSGERSELYHRIADAIENTPKTFPPVPHRGLSRCGGRLLPDCL